MRLWILGLTSYNAFVSVDSGENDISVDQEPIIFAHAFAETLENAKQQAADEFAENYLDLEKPEDPYMTGKENDEKLVDAYIEWENQIDNIKNELVYYELVPRGDHSTYFMS